MLCNILYYSLMGIHTFSSNLYAATLITCHCLSNGWVSDHAYMNIWHMMGGGQKEIFNLFWFSQALNMTFFNKDYIIIHLSLELIPDPSQEFSWQSTWKRKFSVHEINSLIRERWRNGKRSCCSLRRIAWFLHVVICRGQS